MAQVELVKLRGFVKSDSSGVIKYLPEGVREGVREGGREGVRE